MKKIISGIAIALLVTSAAAYANSYSAVTVTNKKPCTSCKHCKCTHCTCNTQGCDNCCSGKTCGNK